MERLRDRQDLRDPVLQRTRELLQNVDPLVVPKTMQDRVRASIAIDVERAHRFPWRSLRWSIVGTLILGGVAGAAVGPTIWSGSRRDPSHSASGSTPKPLTGIEKAPDRSEAQRDEERTAAAQEMTPKTEVRADRPKTAARRNLRTHRGSDHRGGRADKTPRRVARRAPAPDLDAAPLDEPALVAGAIQALRRHRQPREALKLLRDYLSSYPRGSLREEALALALEAAHSVDKLAARKLADQYLDEFPAGRFVGVAQRVRRSTDLK